MSSGFGVVGGFRLPPLPKAPGTGTRMQQQPSLASFLARGQQPTPGSAAPPAAQTDPYNFSADPALQQILATDAAAKSNAQAAALAAEKQLAIQLGDAKGIIGDKQTALEAANNPYSTLATLKKSYGQTQTNTDESMNQNNLFYSGARAKQISSDAYNYQHQQYDARQAALNALSQIQANLASAEYGYAQNDAAANQGAASRAQSQATTYGYDPGSQAPSVASSLSRRPLNQFQYPQ